METTLEKIISRPFKLNGNLIVCDNPVSLPRTNQEQTKEIFSDKWREVEKLKEAANLFKYQFEWFLQLYGFETEQELAKYLKTKKIILDAGSGLGYKAAWFARLAPESLVFAIDISESTNLAAKKFSDLQNLFFIQGDIANSPFLKQSIDFVVCDQVIMHTEIPERTFDHLTSITSPGGEFACYVYRKKALPRELLDDYFREKTHSIPDEDMWALSGQLTQLGKTLSELNVSFECPDIPALGIKGGHYDIQRFLYWNFIKCFWKEDWGFELCKSTNYDWYAPSNAKRFTKEDFTKMIKDNQLEITFLHEEEACYSGRFLKK